MKMRSFFVSAIVAVIMIIGYTIGYNKKECPTIITETITDTIVSYDTIIHTITKHHYTVKRDTVIRIDTIPANIDTLAILSDYFSKHVYSRTWIDSLIAITLTDTISQNHASGTLAYKILRPHTVINNTVNNTLYSGYLFVGMGFNTLDLRYTSIDLTVAQPKGYASVSYFPAVRGVGFRLGKTILKFKE